MKDLPPITARERWLYEKAAPVMWPLVWLLLGFASLIPFCITLNYLWLSLPPLVGLFFHFTVKKLSRYAFLYKARMTKADWKRRDDEIRDDYKDPFEDFITITIPPAVILIVFLTFKFYL